MTRYESDRPFTGHAAVLLARRHGDQWFAADGGGGGGRQLYECADYTEAYARVADKVHSTFPVCEIDRIRQVNAPQMYGMYLLRKEEMLAQCPYAADVQELELYHVTTEARGHESLRGGLDWRRTTRSKYGRGVSFSDDADYADYYANNTSAGDNKRVIIVCAVLVAKTWRVNNCKKNGRSPNSQQLIVPPGTCDTTVSPNGRVYVKYYDHEFYPLYMVYYRRRPEHVPLSRYHNIGNNKKQVVHQQWYPLAETEWRQQEEQPRWQQEMARKQQERRLQEQQDEQKRLWQRQQAERLRQEQLAQFKQQRQQQQAYGRDDNQRSNQNSCSIL